MRRRIELSTEVKRVNKKEAIEQSKQRFEKKRKRYKILGNVLFIVSVAIVIVGAILISSGLTLKNTPKHNQPDYYPIVDKANTRIWIGIALAVFGSFVLFVSLMYIIKSRQEYLPGYHAETPDLDRVQDMQDIENMSNTNTTKVCKYCGVDNNSASKFCKECGRILAKEKRCSQCQSIIEPDTKFCPHCGNKF